MLQSVTEYYRVQQSITDYYRLIQSISSASTWTNFWACFCTFKNFFFKVMKTFSVVYQTADSFMGWKAKIGSEDKETS